MTMVDVMIGCLVCLLCRSKRNLFWIVAQSTHLGLDRLACPGITVAVESSCMMSRTYAIRDTSVRTTYTIHTKLSTLVTPT